MGLKEKGESREHRNTKQDRITRDLGAFFLPVFVHSANTDNGLCVMREEIKKGVGDKHLGTYTEKVLTLVTRVFPTRIALLPEL